MSPCIGGVCDGRRRCVGTCVGLRPPLRLLTRNSSACDILLSRIILIACACVTLLGCVSSSLHARKLHVFPCMRRILFPSLPAWVPAASDGLREMFIIRNPVHSFIHHPGNPSPPPPNLVSVSCSSLTYSSVREVDVPFLKIALASPWRKQACSKPAISSPLSRRGAYFSFIISSYSLTPS